MARTAKKEDAMTSEEKLAQSLVPETEQPYHVPQNWCWAYLPALCDYMRAGGDKPQNMSAIKTEEYQIPVVANGLQDEGIIGYTDIENEKAGTVTVSGRGTIGHSVLRDYPYYPVIRLIVLAPNKAIISEYLKYVFDYFEEEGTGTSIPQLTVPSLKSKSVPLPPIAEQQRIVDRIESLFAKLDEAKEKAQAVVDGFEDRKAAILHKAFNGALTAEWRKDNGYCVDGWEDTILKHVLDVRDGTHDSPQYYDEGFPLVTSKNLKNGKITDKDLKLISKEDYEKINERSKVDIGDILFAMIGTIGNPVVVEEEPRFAIKNVALFKNTGKINPYYVRYYLESKTVIDKMEREVKGSTQKFVSLGYLRNFPIKMPTECEQQIIVKLLDRLFDAEIQAKESAEQVIDQIDTTKKSILARAFRGELDTNDPDDESAEKLLRRVL